MYRSIASGTALLAPVPGNPASARATGVPTAAIAAVSASRRMVFERAISYSFLTDRPLRSSAPETRKRQGRGKLAVKRGFGAGTHGRASRVEVRDGVPDPRPARGTRRGTASAADWCSAAGAYVDLRAACERGRVGLASHRAAVERPGAEERGEEPSGPRLAATQAARAGHDRYASARLPASGRT